MMPSRYLIIEPNPAALDAANVFMHAAVDAGYRPAMHFSTGAELPDTPVDAAIISAGLTMNNGLQRLAEARRCVDSPCLVLLQHLLSRRLAETVLVFGSHGMEVRSGQRRRIVMSTTGSSLMRQNLDPVAQLGDLRDPATWLGAVVTLDRIHNGRSAAILPSHSGVVITGPSPIGLTYIGT